jgi:hypothetical protein
MIPYVAFPVEMDEVAQLDADIRAWQGDRDTAPIADMKQRAEDIIERTLEMISRRTSLTRPLPDTDSREALAEFFGDIRLPNGAGATGHFVQTALDLLEVHRPDFVDWTEESRFEEFRAAYSEARRSTAAARSHMKVDRRDAYWIWKTIQHAMERNQFRKVGDLNVGTLRGAIGWMIEDARTRGIVNEQGEDLGEHAREVLGDDLYDTLEDLLHPQQLVSLGAPSQPHTITAGDPPVEVACDCERAYDHHDGFDAEPVRVDHAGIELEIRTTVPNGHIGEVTPKTTVKVELLCPHCGEALPENVRHTFHFREIAPHGTGYGVCDCGWETTSVNGSRTVVVSEAESMYNQHIEETRGG